MNAADERALCVDLDGTLIYTDLLWESLTSAVREDPLTLLRLPVWLCGGRARLKHQLARAAAIDVAALPYRVEVLDLIRQESARGRRVVLATAADASLAQAVAEHVGLFSTVLASDGATNLKGTAKAALLIETFGRGRFDYIGDSPADVPVWQAAGTALLAGRATIKGVAKLQAVGGRDTVESPAVSASSLAAIVRAIRPHQWLKNLLVFVPAVAAHRVDSETGRQVLIAFAALSLCASGGYVLNDLLDVASDRRHARKRHRPFAAGHLSIATGIVMVTVMWMVGFALALTQLTAGFAALALLYLAATAGYSALFKRIAVLDVMILAGLYVLRVIAGGVATGVPVSKWLLAFTLFGSLTLAFLKRFIEVRAVATTEATQVPGRGYRTDDAAWLHSAGLSSAYLGVLVLALYANSEDVTRLYAHPERLLFVCPVVLYWGTRTWLLAHRGELHDDPVVAVARDPATYVMLVLTGLTVAASI